MSGDGGACACVVCVWCVRRLHGCREECGGSRVLAINVLYPVYDQQRQLHHSVVDHGIIILES